MTTKTLRRRFFSLTGRLTRSARRLTLTFPRAGPGKPVQQRPGPIARPVAPFLTAPDPARQTYPQAWLSRARLGPECLLTPSNRLILPSSTAFGRQQPLSAALAPRTQPDPWGSTSYSFVPKPLIPEPTSATASLRCIRAYEGPWTVQFLSAASDDRAAHPVQFTAAAYGGCQDKANWTWVPISLLMSAPVAQEAPVTVRLFQRPVEPIPDTPRDVLSSWSLATNWALTVVNRMSCAIRSPAAIL